MRWSTDGTHAQIFAAVAANLDVEHADLQELLSVDSTSARAHLHAAGARPGWHTGRPIELQEIPDEPDNHAIGRSRGGLTTKIHALADQIVGSGRKVSNLRLGLPVATGRVVGSSVLV